MSTWREHSDYSPGGLGPRSRRRALARRAGRASGVKRRQLAWARRGHAGNPGRALPLSYELRQPSRAEFDAIYRKHWPEPETAQGAASWRRGRDTVWAHLVASWRLVCATGQHCKTSKPQRAAALANRERPRCPRTIRRANLKLEQMGLAGFSHWRAPKGRKDCLVLEWRLTRRVRSIDVTPASLTVNPASLGVHRRPKDRIPPASPAENDPASAGETPKRLTEEEIDASARAFTATDRPPMARPVDSVRESRPPERSRVPLSAAEREIRDGLRPAAVRPPQRIALRYVGSDERDRETQAQLDARLAAAREYLSRYAPAQAKRAPGQTRAPRGG